MYTLRTPHMSTCIRRWKCCRWQRTEARRYTMRLDSIRQLSQIPPANYAHPSSPSVILLLSMAGLFIEKNQPNCHYPFKPLTKRTGKAIGGVTTALLALFLHNTSSTPAIYFPRPAPVRLSGWSTQLEIASYGPEATRSAVDTRSTPVVQGHVSLKRCCVTLHAHPVVVVIPYELFEETPHRTPGVSTSVHFLKRFVVACWKVLIVYNGFPFFPDKGCKAMVPTDDEQIGHGTT